jgi:tripartite-type tricarboxylate transporter receptor subunit TctC
VKAKAPYMTADDLLQASRASQAGLTFASAGPGTVGQFAAELFRLGLEEKLIHVPYEGAAAAMKAVIDGRVTFYFAPLAAAMPQVRLGKLKILPLPQSPATTGAIDDPGIAKASLQESDMAAWVGVFAPRGTPGAIVSRLNHAINAVLAQPEAKRQLVRDGAFVTPMSADQFAAFVKGESAKYAGLIEEKFCSRPLVGGCFANDEPSR